MWSAFWKQLWSHMSCEGVFGGSEYHFLPWWNCNVWASLNQERWCKEERYRNIIKKISYFSNSFWLRFRAFWTILVYIYIYIYIYIYYSFFFSHLSSFNSPVFFFLLFFLSLFVYLAVSPHLSLLPFHAFFLFHSPACSPTTLSLSFHRALSPNTFLFLFFLSFYI